MVGTRGRVFDVCTLIELKGIFIFSIFVNFVCCGMVHN
jgi:hypothetical protein